MLILGAAAGYKAEDVRPFLRSLQATGYQGQLVFFADGGAAEECKACGWDPEPPGRKVCDRPHANRFFWIRDWLENNPGCPGCTVLCLDTRDVVFQRNPAEIPEHSLISVCEEDRNWTIGSCPYNRKWIEVAYGAEGLAELQDKPILCVGSFYGSRKLISLYLDGYCPTMANLQAKTHEYQDQAVHNHFVYNHPSVFHILRNEDAANPVYTVGYIRPLDPPGLVFAGRVLRKDGSMPTIVHQWDRHPALKGIINGVYQ